MQNDPRQMIYSSFVVRHLQLRTERQIKRTLTIRQKLQKKKEKLEALYEDAKKRHARAAELFETVSSMERLNTPAKYLKM
eukprot:8465115-Alexandrium_andersonii.AAC.1